MTSLHSDLIEDNLHQAFHYEQNADPGAVGAGKYWLDTNSGPPRLLWRRDASNTGWDAVGATGGGGAATQIEETSGPDTLDIAAIADGTFLKRVGTDVVGATPSSGGNAIDTPPVSPNAMDDEFDDTSGNSGSVNGLNARWAWRNQGGASINWPEPGWGNLKIATAAGPNWRHIEQTIPAGQNFEITCKLSVGAKLANFWRAGLTFTSAGGAVYAFGFAYSTGMFVDWQRYTSATVFNSTVFSGLVSVPGPLYLRYIYTLSGTTIEAQMSRDGVDGSWCTLGVITDAITITKVGIGIDQEGSGADLNLNVDWFRRTA